MKNLIIITAGLTASASIAYAALYARMILGGYLYILDLHPYVSL